jgi:hypothetical protein
MAEFRAKRLAVEIHLNRCELLVIDLNTGDAVHWLRISGIIEELYDVAALAGVRRPMAVGLKSDEIRRVLSVEPQE